MPDLFRELVYIPIYNLLVFLIDTIPGADLGIAVIAVTLAIKFILMPLSLVAVKTQKAMRVLEPLLKELREKYKDDKETQARELFALYKKHNVKPFASILLLFIQIPIVLGLYLVCSEVATHPLYTDLLYSFIQAPEHVTTLFLGFFTVAHSSIALALFAGFTQYLYARYAIPVPEKSTATSPSMQEEFGRMMAVQARFMFPVLIALFSYASGALALYFAASNLFMVVQEYIARTFLKHPESKTNNTLPSSPKAV
jgi:YidC/Oxa1 family membrane protein insertase